MRLRDLLQSPTQALLSHPRRTFLTMLGVIVGNAAFIAMASLSESTKIYTIRKIENFYGPNRLVAAVSRTDEERKKGKKHKLYLADSYALADGAPAIQRVAPVVAQSFGITRNDKFSYNYVIGTTSDYLLVNNDRLQSGRFFTSIELENRSAVVVIGSKVADNFFRNGSGIGESLVINGVPFRVVGRLNAKGSLGKDNPDDYVYVPISTFLVTMRGVRPDEGLVIDYITISAADKTSMNDAKFQATNILNAREPGRISEVTTDIPFQDLINQVSSSLTLLLAIVAFLSLSIGGIGIMNVMLASVAERIREIGLRKAVGARNNHIFTIFLIESSLISAVGGALGICGGIIVVVIVAIATPLPFAVPIWAVVTSITLSTCVGILSGVGPAIYASRMNPISALHTT